MRTLEHRGAIVPSGKPWPAAGRPERASACRLVYWAPRDAFPHRAARHPAARRRRCAIHRVKRAQYRDLISVRVRKAVLPAAGFGTRFLPATKAIPKEVLPLVDRPIIQYAVEEAVASGIEQIIIVITTGRSAIEDHFDSNPTLERWLEERGDIEMLRAVRRITEIGTDRLRAPEGAARPGARVLMAKELVGDEPFAVLLSDDVMLNPGGPPVTGQLIEQYAAHRGIGDRRSSGSTPRGRDPLRHRRPGPRGGPAGRDRATWSRSRR